MASNNDRRRINENYEPPFDAAGYKPGSPKMKRVEGSGAGVVGGERRQLKGGHGGTEQTHPKNKNRVNDKGIVSGSEMSSSHGEASDGFQEKVGHDWPDGPQNDGASSEFITGYDYTGAAPEPKLEGWNPDSIGSMIGEEYNLQDMFNQYAGTRRSVNMLEFKNVCRANGFDYPLSEDMFRQLIENNKEFVFTEHHDGIHRFYISESDMGLGYGEELDPKDPNTFNDRVQAAEKHRNTFNDRVQAAEKHRNTFNDRAQNGFNDPELGAEGSCGAMGAGGWGAGEDGEDDWKPAELDYDAPKSKVPFPGKPNSTYDEEGPADIDTSGAGGWGTGEEGQDDWKPAELDYDAPTPKVPFPGKPNSTYDEEGPADIDTSGAGGWGFGGDGCECTTDGGECKCPPFCKKCKPASGSCGSGKCGGGKKDDMAEGLQRKLTRFFTEARSIIKENARYGRRIIGAKLNESWDCNAGYCKITSSQHKVGQALNMLKNRYPSFNPLFENTQEVMKTGYMIDKAEGKKTEEGGKEPSMSDFKEVTAKGLNNRQPKNGLTGKPKEYPK